MPKQYNSADTKRDKAILISSLSSENGSDYNPSYHRKLTDAIALMASADQVKNDITNTISYISNSGVTATATLEKLTGVLGVKAHKMLLAGIEAFTAENSYNSKLEIRSLKVYIPLKEYARKRGYDVIEHETDTQEAEEIEGKRAENALKNARKQFNQDLNVLKSFTFSWKENVKSKTGIQDFLDIDILGGKGIRNGYIYMEFTQSFAEYLLQLPITQTPGALQGTDDRNPNSYTLGLAMVEHYNIDNNQRRKTADRLKVSTLLKYTNLPEIDDTSVKHAGWRDRLQDPLEKSLDNLVDIGILERWEYCKELGTPLDDEELDFPDGYNEWIDTLVNFTLLDPPDHTSRLEAKEEKLASKNSKKNLLINKQTDDLEKFHRNFYALVYTYIYVAI